MAALGVTTVEAKSGYGLNLEDELKQLRCIAQLAVVQPLELVPTLLAAHVVPPEYRERRADYVRLICDRLIPAVSAQHLAQFCDVFVEQSAFTLAEAREILTCAKAHGLGVKLHADQLSAGGGAELAAELGAISADHLERTSRQGLEQLVRNGVVGVNLPLAALYTFEKPFDARNAMDLGLAVAVATDFNPGSAPSYHLPLALLLACTLSRMTPHEALKGATILAARALGLEARLGSLEPGKRADFALMDAPSVMHWLYHFRPTRALLTVKRGRAIHDRRSEAP
jgi:imidazolonepropionase